jgi:hypothetical protein
MSKGKAATASNGEGASTEPATNVAGEEVRPTFTPPQGLEKISQDVVGFWDFEKGPVYFIPKEAVLIDSTIKPDKCNILVLGKLVESNPFLYLGEDDVTGEAGQLVGVWVRPGFARQLKECAGRPTWISPVTGEKVMKGKGKHPMKTFDLHSDTTKPDRSIPIMRDGRKESKNSRHPWEDVEVMSHASTNGSSQPAADGGF